MIDISKLKKGSRIICHWTEGDTATSDFIVTSVLHDPDNGWICEADWSDDDCSTTIYEKDQDKYEYGRRRNDHRPKTPKEIKDNYVQTEPLK